MSPRSRQRCPRNAEHGIGDRFGSSATATLTLGHHSSSHAARLADLHPWPVNRICRSLERAGMVRRRPGPDGKVVNEWLGNRDQGPESIPGPASEAVSGKGTPADPSATADGAVPAGDSAEQCGAERVMLDLLGAQLGLELNPDSITVPSGERVQVDGADASRRSWPSAGHIRGRRRARKSTRPWPMPSSWPR